MSGVSLIGQSLRLPPNDHVEYSTLLGILWTGSEANTSLGLVLLLELAALGRDRFLDLAHHVFSNVCRLHEGACNVRSSGAAAPRRAAAQSLATSLQCHKQERP